MEDVALKINDLAGDISAALETIYGQMDFFSKLITDMENHPDVSALYVKYGLIQRNLYAVYHLLNYELKKIDEAKKDISKLTMER